MAPLKLVYPGVCTDDITYFHNEKVMAPLKPTIVDYSFGEDNHNFHNEKVMAPLKRSVGKKNMKKINNFHNEKVMAPLKQHLLALRLRLR